MEAVAGLAQRHEQPDRLAAVHAVVVDPVLEAGLAVRQVAQRGAGQALGIVDDLAQVDAHGLGPVPADQVDDLALGDVAGGELGAQVAEELDRQAHVLLQQREQRLVARAPVVHAERRNTHALLVDLGGIGGIGAGDPAADIGVMADGGGEGQALSPIEDRLEHEDVRQVHAAVEGVVHDEDIAGMDVVAVVAQHRLDRRRHRAEMARQREPLRDQAAGAVGERGREIHVVAQDARIGRAADGERHLVRDGEDGVPEEREAEGIGAACARRIGRARRLDTLCDCLHAPLPGWPR